MELYPNMQLSLLTTIKGSTIKKKKKSLCLDPHLFLKISAESKRSIFVTEAQKNPSFLYSPHLSTKLSLRKKEISLLCSAVSLYGDNTDRENSKFTSTSQIIAIIVKGAILRVIVLFLVLLHKYSSQECLLKI